MLLNLLRKSQMRFIRFCDDQKPRGVLVDSRDDSRAQHAADTAQLIQSEKERVDERTLRLTVADMYGHALRLVDDGDIVVLIDYVYRDILRLY